MDFKAARSQYPDTPGISSGLVLQPGGDMSGKAGKLAITDIPVINMKGGTLRVFFRMLRKGLCKIK